MADAFEKRMAKRALASMKGTKNPSLQQNEVASSARKILKGSASPDDVKRVRNYTGDHVGISSKLSRATKAFNSAMQPFSNITSALDQLATTKAAGTGTAASEQRLFRTVLGELNKFSKRPFVKDVAKKVAGFMSNDPMLSARMLKSAGRIFRGAAAAGGIFLGGVQAVERFYAERRRGAEATSRTLDTTRNLRTDPRLARSIRQQALNRVKRASFLQPTEDLDTGEITEFVGNLHAQEAEKAVQREVEAIEAARSAAQEFGIDVPTTLGRYASSKGKTIADLTDRERNEAIDRAVQLALVRSPKFRDEQRHFADHKFRMESSEQGFLDKFRTEDQIEARKEQHMQEYKDRVMKSAGSAQAARLEAGAQALERMTPAKWYLIQDQSQTARAMYRAAASRHQAWLND